MATLVRVRRKYRTPLRLGKTLISNAATGTVVDLDDPQVMTDFKLKLTNFIVLNDAKVSVVENFPFTDAANNALAAVLTGQLRLVPIHLAKGQKVTNIVLYSGGTALTPGASVSNQFVGLYSFDGATFTKVSGSADKGDTAIGASAAVTYAQSSVYTVPTEGRYYAGALVKLNGAGGTVPTLAGASLANAAIAGVGGVKRSGIGTATGLVALPATVAVGAVTFDALLPYINVS